MVQFNYRGALRGFAMATVSVAALQAGTAFAQTATTTTTTTTTVAPAPAAPAAVALNGPAMSVPLSADSTPYSIDVGPLGKWYVGGALTGLGLVQSNSTAVDDEGRADLDNGMVFVQKVDGMLQFFVAAGAYTFPTIGTSYDSVDHTMNDFFGAVPVAYVKVAATPSLTLEAGKLFTLIGAEGLFTYQNMNIERGLLWNQEPAVSRGVQASYVSGPFTFNISLNDGYYSNVFNQVSGSIAWAINSSNTLSVVGGGALGHSSTVQFATPTPQNNGSIYNIIYTYTSGPLTITPYFQANIVPKRPEFGYTKSAHEISGAVLANYNIDSNWSLSARLEYLSSSGSATNGAPNLTFYGAGSNAFSFTITPTWQYNRFYIRPEASVVTLSDVTDGDAFGSDGTKKTQIRGLIEAGVLF